MKKNFRVYGNKNSMSLLYSKDISQYFTGCTFKLLPHELKGNCVLLIIGTTGAFAIASSLGFEYKRL